VYFHKEEKEKADKAKAPEGVGKARHQRRRIMRN
jgi:hypothetical protein